MVSCQTAVQVNVDEHYRGRVLSIYVMCFFAGTPIGALVGGIVAEVDRAAGDDRRLGGAARRARSGVTLLRYPGFRVLDESMLGFDTRRSADGAPDVHGADLDTAAHLIVEPLD